MANGTSGDVLVHRCPTLLDTEAHSDASGRERREGLEREKGAGFQAFDNTCTFKEEEVRRNKKQHHTRRALTLERFPDALKQRAERGSREELNSCSPWSSAPSRMPPRLKMNFLPLPGIWVQVSTYSLTSQIQGDTGW